MERVDEVLLALRRISAAFESHSKRLARETGLTAPQLMVLAAARRMERPTIGVLARAVALSQATVTSLVDRLERKGLLSRARGAVDRRKVYVAVTPSGMDLLEHAPPPLQPEFVAGYAGLAEWEQTQILSSLQRVVSLMQVSDESWVSPAKASSPSQGSEAVDSVAGAGDEVHAPPPCNSGLS